MMGDERRWPPVDRGVFLRGRQSPRRWLRWRALFAWRQVYNSGVYSYLENTLTGERRVLRTNQCGHQPIDVAWLKFERNYVGRPPGALE